MRMSLVLTVPVFHKQLRDEDLISIIEGTADVIGIDPGDIELEYREANE